MGGFVLSHSLRIHSTLSWRNNGGRNCEVDGHIGPTLKKEKQIGAGVICFLFVFSSRLQPWNGVAHRVFSHPS